VPERDRVQISALVSPAIRQRLQHAAIDTGRTQSEIVEQALADYLDKIKK
jgi:predicted transcriptional regulator